MLSMVLIKISRRDRTFLEIKIKVYRFMIKTMFRTNWKKNYFSFKRTLEIILIGEEKEFKVITIGKISEITKFSDPHTKP